MTVAVAVAAALVSLVMTMLLFERWLERRRRQELTWTIALALFVLGAGSLAWGAGLGWTRAPFRAFYLFGAIANVPFLAAGQLELSQWRYRHAARPVAALFGAVALGVCVSAPMHLTRTDALPQGSDVFGALPRILAAAGSGIAATIVLVGAAGGVWKAWRQDRRRRAVGTALIALGTVVLSSSGLLNSVLGAMRAFAVTLAIGVTVLFAGFVLATGTNTGTGTNTDFGTGSNTDFVATSTATRSARAAATRGRGGSPSR